MTYSFIDEVVALELGERPRIEVLKVFPAHHWVLSGPAGRTRVPGSMLLELLATTGGHLIFQKLAGRYLPVLLKVRECRFEGPAPPGVAFRAVAELGAVSGDDRRAIVAEARGEVLSGREQLASARLLYLCVRLSSLSVDGDGFRA